VATTGETDVWSLGTSIRNGRLCRVGNPERSDQPRCCGNPSWTWPAGISGGWLEFSIQELCQCKRFENTNDFKTMLILQCINWMTIHAFFEGMRSKNKLRIIMLRK
jgi:hypothetical protein